MLSQSPVPFSAGDLLNTHSLLFKIRQVNKCYSFIIFSSITFGAIASTAGVGLSIPPVAPADVPALFHPRIGTFTCGATNIYLRCWNALTQRGMYTSGGCCTVLGKTLAIWITTCGAIASTAGVDLSIPPVAPADVPAIFHPIIRTSTCGANINYTFFPKNCILFERRTQNVRLMCYLCSVNTK